MNAPLIPRSLMLLLAIGAVAILLLGAFSRLDPAAVSTSAPPSLPGDTLDATVQSAGEPELPANLSPGLGDIIRLAQAHVDEAVILAFVHNSGQIYAPAADEILYLSDLGLSQTVIGALSLYKQPPPVVPETASIAALSESPSPGIPAAEAITNAGLFYKALAPYGAWTQISDYGLCWQPTTATVNPDWRPYVDQGQWLYTDNGWYWQSDYSWGWAVFHYGRWSKHDRLGWLWVPDRVWGPAWVSWKIALSYSGWAPLPPGVGIAAAGLTFNHRHIAADFDLGVPAGWFTFVNEGNFLNQNLPKYALSASQAASIYVKSVAVNNYSIANQIVFNLGPGRGVIPAAAEQIPSREYAPSAQPRSVSGNNLAPLLAYVGPEETASAMSGSSLALPATPSPQLPSVRHHHWVERSSGYPRLAGTPRWEPLGGHESFHHDQSAGSFARAVVPEPARMTMLAPGVSVSAKSGK